MCKCPRRSPTPRRRYKVCSSLAGDISFAQDPPVGIQWASSRDPVGTCVGIAAGWRERGRLPLGCRANRGRHGRSNTGVTVGESRGRVRSTDQPVMGNARRKQVSWVASRCWPLLAILPHSIEPTKDPTKGKTQKAVHWQTLS